MRMRALLRVERSTNDNIKNIWQAGNVKKYYNKKSKVTKLVELGTKYASK